MSYPLDYIRYFFLWAIFLTACREQDNLALKLSVYHWKTELALSPWEEAYLDSLAVENVYLRIMDIDWDPYRQEAVIVSPVQIKNFPRSSPNLIPSIFITLNTLKNISPDSIPSLAQKIQESIMSRMASYSQPLTEVQLDHDWNSKTREAFFGLLKEVKLRFPPEVQVSSTLRLHQYKYPLKTGVPPADRVMLMVYNMASVRDIEVQNSIIDIDIAREYLHNTPSYPLPSDLALPIFSWAAIFRDGVLVRLLPGPTPGSALTRFPWKEEKQDHWSVLKGHYYAGYYLYAGDRIRFEYVSQKALQELTNLLAKEKNQAWERIAFFHLDEALGRKYPSRFLRQLQETLRP